MQPTRQSIPGAVVAAGILGILHGGFVAFIFFALYSLSNGEIFTFDRVGTVIGLIGIALGVSIFVSAIFVFFGRLRWVLLTGSVIAAVPALAFVITGKLGGLLTLATVVVPIVVVVLLLVPTSTAWFRGKALARRA